MFHDLDEASWNGALSDHPLLGRVLGGSEGGEATFAEEHDVDSKQVADAVPLLVLEADASQHSAVYDVMTGKSLVIEGPRARASPRPSRTSSRPRWQRTSACSSWPTSRPRSKR